ncbi:MAG: type VI secretion system tip protein TssI/VgrG [Novosphingobium sp.]|nr:type VI secretion system tip protein TssI/VgrG [Novosphingobium sp.]
MVDNPVRQTTLALRLGNGAEQLKLIRLDAFEALSEHFAITLEVISLDEIELLPNLGKTASIESKLDGQVLRHFHGIVVDAEFMEELEDLGFVYRLVLAPAAQIHDNGSNYRIFQAKPVIDIIKTVLSECGLDFEVKATSGTRQLAYCVQYGESNFDFISRLMEEEGLYYYYQHSASAHTMVICDKPGCHVAMPAGPMTYNPVSASTALVDSLDRGGTNGLFVQSWHERASTGGEARVTMRDYDFKEPTRARQAEATDKCAHPLDDIEIYTWPGRYYQESAGQTLSTVVLESRRAQRLRYEGTSTYAGIETGYHLELKNHPINRLCRKYLVVRCRTTLATEQFRSGGSTGRTFVEVTTVPHDVNFRAPIVTPRPIARGPETAVVTGPAGEEIHVDEFGRIKVQFFWDREGKLDDKSSCWIRVSQTGGLGNIIIPRIGHEVLIDFINGNPDRPIVVGRVFNASHMPVYKLPDNKTRALWRTKTYKRTKGDSLSETEALDTGAPGANELRFEDATGKEEVFLHAERDMNTRVRHNETHKVGRDVEISVGKNRKERVGKNEEILIEGERKEVVKGTETVTVHKDRKVEIKSNDKLDVTKTIVVNAGDSIKISANSKITLSCGGSTITLEPASIKISTTQLSMQGQATAKLSSAMTKVEASGILTAQGGLVKIN